MRLRGASGALAALLLVVAMTAFGALRGAAGAETAPVSLEDATLEWGFNAESNSGAFNGQCNFMSAGESDGTAATYRSTDEGLTVLKRAADDTMRPISDYASRCLDRFGNKVTPTGTTTLDQVARFTGGVGTRDPSTGALSIAWKGTVSINFYGELVPFWMSDPALSVDPDGTGVLTATMGGYGSDIDDPENRRPLDPVGGVVVANLSGVDLSTVGGFSVAPDFEGVVVEGGDAPQYRLNPGWGSWPLPFVDFHGETGLAGFWYSTGGIADLRKKPLPLTVGYAEGTAPTTTLPPTTVPPTTVPTTTVPPSTLPPTTVPPTTVPPTTVPPTTVPPRTGPPGSGSVAAPVAGATGGEAGMGSGAAVAIGQLQRGFATGSAGPSSSTAPAASVGGVDRRAPVSPSPPPSSSGAQAAVAEQPEEQGATSAVSSGAATAGRQDAGENQPGWSVAPTRQAGGGVARSDFSLGGDPGEVVEDSLTITNNLGDPMVLRAMVEPATDAPGEQESGTGSDSTGSDSIGIADWVELDDERIEVPAGASATLGFQVEVPDNAAPGDHAATLVLAGDQEPDRRSVVLHMRVGGPLRPELRFESLAVSYDQSWNPFAPGAMSVTYEVVNSGNVRVGSQVSVVVDGALGSVRDDASDVAPLLPGESVTRTQQVAGIWPTLGTDVAVELTPYDPMGARDSDALPTSTATTSTTAWPLGPVLLLLSMAGLGAFALWRRRAHGAVDIRRSQNIRHTNEAMLGIPNTTPEQMTGPRRDHP